MRDETVRFQSKGKSELHLKEWGKWEEAEVKGGVSTDKEMVQHS